MWRELKHSLTRLLNATPRPVPPPPRKIRGLEFPYQAKWISRNRESRFNEPGSDKVTETEAGKVKGEFAPLGPK
jgi:hypothetical protein